MTKVANAVSQDLIFFGSPIRKSVGCQGPEDVPVPFGALIILPARDQVGNLIPRRAEAGIRIEEYTVLFLGPPAFTKRRIQ